MATNYHLPQGNIKSDRRLWVLLLVIGTAAYTVQIRRSAVERGLSPETLHRLQIDFISIPKSDKYITENNIQECYFASFYDAYHYPFSLKEYSYVEIGNWRAMNNQRDGSDDTEDVEYIQFSLKRTEWERKRAQQKDPKLPAVQRNLTYVHVGKAGGSTIGCNLRDGREYVDAHCDNINYDGIKDYRADQEEPYIPESAISRSVNCYTHWGMNLHCYYLNSPDNNQSFLINLRSPLKRIASWFTYEHTENHDAIYPDRPHHCGQLVLNSCYQHFEHLTTVGLSYPRPPMSQPLKVGTNLSALECSYWAWTAVQGHMPADYHNAWNYDWYAHRLLYDPRVNTSDIFALRIEHLEQDWGTVDKMLGGDGSFPTTMANRQNWAEMKPLRISNHSTTDQGTLNLCRALCDEIQMYKRLLLRSVNLKPEDLKQSIEELQQTCPEETDIDPRECRYD